MIALVSVPVLSIFAASLITKTFEFSQDVMLNKKCYVDVIEIEPLAGSYDGEIRFVYTDKEDVEEAKKGNQVAVEFSDSVLEGRRVYVTLVSIVPAYEVSNLPYSPLFSTAAADDYICCGICEDGTTAWIYISANEYKQYFSRNSGKVTLDHAILYGTAKKSRQHQ